MNLNEEYKLKKDLPTLKAGAIFVRSNLYTDGVWVCGDDINARYYFTEKDLSHQPEWFEKVDNKWKPSLKQSYFYLDFINILLRKDFHIHERLNINHEIDEFNFKIGNVFETELDAAFCREEFIKPAFKKFHKQYPPGSLRG